MRKLANGWEFTRAWTDGFARGLDEGEPVRLPHCPREITQHGAGPKDYEGVYGYRKLLPLDESVRGKRLFLQFDGAAHLATVYVNGNALLTHRCGYTAFRAEITGCVRCDGTDLVAVRLDASENPEIPPFGYVIDYLTYGGLYRDVWLDVRNETCIADVFVYTPDLSTAQMQVCFSGGSASFVGSRVLDADGTCLCRSIESTETAIAAPDNLAVWIGTLNSDRAIPWTDEAPYLYTLETTLYDADMQPQDRVLTRFGFRTAEFRADGL